ncbi:MAG: hypothetical protein ACKKL5_03720 [Candidatus Komeilibacteria bacterium]
MNNQKGTILLIAVMIMATILTAALATGTLVINIINQSATIDYSITGFYAAESGIEKTLYRIRHDDYVPPLKLYGVAADDEGFADKQDAIDSDTFVLDSGSADFSLTAINGQDEMVIDLLANQEYQLNLYDPNSPQQDLAIRRLDLIGNGENLDPVTVQVSWVGWSGTGNLQIPGANIFTFSAGDNEPKATNLTAAALIKVRIRALDGNLANVIVRGYDNAVDPSRVSIPGIYVVQSTGTYPAGSSRAASQIVNVKMPIIAPTYGLYNFVIFSEGAINKTVNW